MIWLYTLFIFMSLLLIVGTASSISYWELQRSMERDIVYLN